MSRNRAAAAAAAWSWKKSGGGGVVVEEVGGGGVGVDESGGGGAGVDESGGAGVDDALAATETFTWWTTAPGIPLHPRVSEPRLADLGHLAWIILLMRTCAQLHTALARRRHHDIIFRH